MPDEERLTFLQYRTRAHAREASRLMYLITKRNFARLLKPPARAPVKRYLASRRLYPALKLLGGSAQHIAADRIKVSIGSEKAHDPLGLLNGWISPFSRIRSKHR